MAYREIPTGSVEVQTGLWWYTYTKTIGGVEYTFGQLYSEQGYCFYKVDQPENYDEDRNLLPANQRVYFTYSAGYTTLEQINASIVSVIAQDGYEIVSVGGNNHVTA